MDVRTGATFDNGRRVDIGINDADMIAQVGAERWEAMTLTQRNQTMLNAADLLVVNYLRASGEIGDEYYRQRVREIRDRFKHGG